MLKDDNEEIARAKSETVQDPRVVQFWDYERATGRLFADVLHLQKIAWDVYLLYSPRISWEMEGEPPKPVFWMH